VGSEATRPQRNLTAADIMTADEVAQLLTVATATVYEWARTGTLPALRRGRVVRFRRWEIEAWIAGEL
jgi:excisionase family DNA binding protein